mmetsp:Transcript_5193/g.14719  ORF Transcript_5193/g.14719 Transcript_5193/m.14719 type:complete len:273 (-) Transcript_5193:169-987(-)
MPHSEHENVPHFIRFIDGGMHDTRIECHYLSLYPLSLFVADCQPALVVAILWYYQRQMRRQNEVGEITMQFDITPRLHRGEKTFSHRNTALVYRPCYLWKKLGIDGVPHPSIYQHQCLPSLPISRRVITQGTGPDVVSFLRQRVHISRHAHKLLFDFIKRTLQLLGPVELRGIPKLPTRQVGNVRRGKLMAVAALGISGRRILARAHELLVRVVHLGPSPAVQNSLDGFGATELIDQCGFHLACECEGTERPGWRRRRVDKCVIVGFSRCRR